MQTYKRDMLMLKSDTPTLKWDIVDWWRRKVIRGDIKLVIFGSTVPMLS